MADGGSIKPKIINQRRGGKLQKRLRSKSKKKGEKRKNACQDCECCEIVNLKKEMRKLKRLVNVLKKELDDLPLADIRYRD